jgi:hypothetical protein
VIVIVLVLIVGPRLFIEPGSKALSNAFERERPRIVTNFARLAGVLSLDGFSAGFGLRSSTSTSTISADKGEDEFEDD